MEKLTSLHKLSCTAPFSHRSSKVLWRQILHSWVFPKLYVVDQLHLDNFPFFTAQESKTAQELLQGFPIFPTCHRKVYLVRHQYVLENKAVLGWSVMNGWAGLRAALWQTSRSCHHCHPMLWSKTCSALPYCGGQTAATQRRKCFFNHHKESEITRDSKMMQPNAFSGSCYLDKCLSHCFTWGYLGKYYLDIAIPINVT